MARRSLPERLAQLEAQTLALKARLEKQTRAEDTRRRILLGGLVQQALDTDAPIAPALRAWLQEALPAVVTRRADRALFEDLLPDQPASGDETEGAPAGARA